VARIIGFISVSVSLRAFAQMCDPSEPPPVIPPAEIPISFELFKDELTARGKCTSGQGTLVDGTEDQRSLRCDGVCQPMRQRLAPLDGAHDLEDQTFQNECEAAILAVPKPSQPNCLQVCIVERRRTAAKLVFDRTLRVLNRKLGGSQPPFDTKTLGPTFVGGSGSPPSSIRFRVLTLGSGVVAEGSLYPGGPRLRVSTYEHDCQPRPWRRR
jgi:hypothetical protein